MADRVTHATDHSFARPGVSSHTFASRERELTDPAGTSDCLEWGL
jgi:hypothetical protein